MQRRRADQVGEDDGDHLARHRRLGGRLAARRAARRSCRRSARRCDWPAGNWGSSRRPRGHRVGRAIKGDRRFHHRGHRGALRGSLGEILARHADRSEAERRVQALGRLASVRTDQDRPAPRRRRSVTARAMMALAMPRRRRLGRVKRSSTMPTSSRTCDAGAVGCSRRRRCAPGRTDTPAPWRGSSRAGLRLRDPAVGRRCARPRRGRRRAARRGTAESASLVTGRRSRAGGAARSGPSRTI